MLRLIPNILTLARLVLTIIFLVMVLYSPRVENRAFFLDITFVVFVVAGVTDLVDGPIARWLHVTSKFGRMIDPLADKILVCGTFICFALIGEPRLFGLGPAALAIFHWSVAGVLMVYVTVLRHIAEARGINFAATFSGKIKMFLQSFAIGTVIIKMAHVQTATWGYWFTTVVFAATLIVTVISGARATQRRSWKQAAAVTS
ncbi:MAG: CDP-alcohol phosphatidyltransferase family protein [Planctomycetota bacterium]|jgi:CDP-diacylglycerol--glycerol-3-phosphate 3-phosphatidyltransferase